VAGSEELRIPPEAVIRHAASVDQAADGMETGRGAAAQVQMGDEAYGQICGFLPELIDVVADGLVSALGESASALRETAVSLRSAASSAEDVDVAEANRIGTAGGRMVLPL
jgi:hypothetical protein